MLMYYADGPIHRPFRRALEAAGLEQTNDLLEDWDLYVPDFGIDFEDKLHNLLPSRIDQWIGGLPRSYWITNKGNLWRALVNRYARTEAARLMPETWILSRPQQRVMMKKRWTPQTTLISKNPRLQRRQGLRLVSNPQEAIALSEEGYVLTQRLITDQLLVSGYRFHARLYLMVVVVEQELTAWVHDLGRVIYTRKPVSESEGFDAWITRSRGSHELPPELPFTWAELKDTQPLVSQDRVSLLLGRMLRAVLPYLQRGWALASNPAFQYFGVDVLFSADGRPWLLECNKGPDMTAKCRRDRALKATVMRDVLCRMDVPDLPEWPAGFRWLFRQEIVPRRRQPAGPPKRRR